MPFHAASGAPALDHVAGQCGDFLGRMHLKPHGAHYVGCSYLPDRQGKPLQATYRVPGPLARHAERVFVQALRMPPLRRACCHWDGPEHWFRGADGREYGIVMASDETAGAGTRADWPGIPSFEIVVEVFTEDI